MSCDDCESHLRRHTGWYADVNPSLVVDQNPEAFVDAYWEINSLRVYTPVVG